MLSVRTLAAESGNPMGVLSLNHLITERTETTNSLRLAFAASAFEKKYQAHGGFSSALGMPVTAAYEARNKLIATPTGNGYLAQFRSGNLVLDGSATDTPKAQGLYEAQVFLVALECRDKQEVTDEVIGSVGCIRPSDKTNWVTPIGEKEMGEGLRIAEINALVYQGPFANINLTCDLVEKDSGDTTKYRKAFAKVIEDAAKMGATAAGVPAEAVAGGEEWMRDLSLGLSNIVFDLFGADDDPYNSLTFMIKASEMQARKDGQLPDKILKRADYPNEITYTHSRFVTGNDDGGDRGEYGFYFTILTRPSPEEFD